MNKEKALVVFVHKKRDICVDLEIPLYITANDLVFALNRAYDLDIDVTNIKNCYLKAERPIVFLKGDKTLAEFGIRNGSIISYSE